MADVLVRGMEMPTCCSLCPCFNDEYYYCQAADMDLGRIPVESRHPDCPLIEVSEDVQPVKHGKWEEVQEWMGDVEYSCSVCGCYALWKELTTDQVCTEYCPHCGAKMDGET